MAERYVLGAALCEVFGLPANRVRRLSLSFDGSPVVRVDVELLPTADELKNAEQVIASFRFRVDRDDALAGVEG